MFSFITISLCISGLYASERNVAPKKLTSILQRLEPAEDQKRKPGCCERITQGIAYTMGAIGMVVGQ
jgi:hypothetical protein